MGLRSRLRLKIVALEMPVLQSITEEILELKRRRRAIILAHHYQESEIQELADAIGDSLELARAAQRFEGDVIPATEGLTIDLTT